MVTMSRLAFIVIFGEIRLELDNEGYPSTEMCIFTGRERVGRSSLWINPDDNRVYSVRREKIVTEDLVTIRITTLPIFASRNSNALATEPAHIETTTMTKQEYFKRRLAGEFGDLK